MDYFRRSDLGFYQRTGKRAFDLMLAVTLTIGLLIPFILITLILSVLPGSSPFFLQERVGVHGKIFRLMKFRTLSSDVTKTLQERRFFFGDLLRFTNLDEMPQIINVLKGEMSFVGPRPLPLEYLPLYSAEQNKRHLVRPGITGWAQVNGRHSIQWKQKFEFDLEYTKQISFTTDLKIIVKTILLILSFRPDQSLHEKKFTGNHD